MPFVDFQPTLDNWHYILVDLRNDTLRPYINTVVVGVTSATLTLLFGSMAAYALARFQYQPRVGAIASFLGMVILIAAGRDCWECPGRWPWCRAWPSS